MHRWLRDFGRQFAGRGSIDQIEMTEREITEENYSGGCQLQCRRLQISLLSRVILSGIAPRALIQNYVEKHDRGCGEVVAHKPRGSAGFAQGCAHRSMMAVNVPYLGCTQTNHVDTSRGNPDYTPESSKNLTFFLFSLLDYYQTQTFAICEPSFFSNFKQWNSTFYCFHQSVVKFSTNSICKLFSCWF